MSGGLWIAESERCRGVRVGLRRGWLGGRGARSTVRTEQKKPLPPNQEVGSHGNTYSSTYMLSTAIGVRTTSTHHVLLGDWGGRGTERAVWLF